jgi:hypothetical protein
MITIAKELRSGLKSQEHEQYLRMLPKIRGRARRAFGKCSAELREEWVQEVMANAYCAFVALVRRGKSDLAYATPLANYAIRQAISGRRVGSKLNVQDVLSHQAQEASGIVVERLDTFDEVQGEWRQALLEDRRATPAEIAIARIDVAEWLRSLSRRNRRIAMTLAMGETTSNVARQFHLSSARVSQLRRQFEASWERFQAGDQQHED